MIDVIQALWNGVGFFILAVIGGAIFAPVALWLVKIARAKNPQAGKCPSPDGCAYCDEFGCPLAREDDLWDQSGIRIRNDGSGHI